MPGPWQGFRDPHYPIGPVCGRRNEAHPAYLSYGKGRYFGWLQQPGGRSFSSWKTSRCYDAGYDVVEAGNADEAIAILEARADIHIVFTDIQMPGSMDGLKLARFVRDRWPPIKLVATSGRVTIGEGDLPEGGLFIPEPYTAARIAEVLRSLAAPA
jgi:two-component system, response regulator PdtaR